LEVIATRASQKGLPLRLEELQHAFLPRKIGLETLNAAEVLNPKMLEIHAG
jgi:hypothetical protein